MKAIVALQNKMNRIQAKAFECLKKKEGQNTIEYVLMLVVVVGIAMVAGMALKKFAPELVEKVKAKIFGGVDSVEY